MNGNIEYPAQLGYAVNGVDGSVRQYARMKNTEPSGTLSWKNWIEVATKDYVDDKILVIDKIITLPEGATTRGVVEVSVDYGSRRIMSYSVLAAESGASFHVQAAYTGDGKLTFVYDKQGTNSFNVMLRLTFM